MTEKGDFSMTGRLGALIDTQLQVRRLRAFNTHIDDVSLSIKSEKAAWQLNIDSDVLSGYARVQRPFDSGNALDIHFDHLNYDAIKVNYIDPLEEVPLLDPRQIPPFTVTLDKLWWQSYLFKQVNIVAKPTDEGILLSPISIDNKDMHMGGSGLWAYQAQTGEHNTSLEMHFGSRDIGKALVEMGKEAVIGEGHGFLSIDLNWPSALYSPDTKTLDGKVHLKLNEGRILTVDPGAGRLVGLLALQELPRRLLFDFSDATGKGTELIR